MVQITSFFIATPRPDPISTRFYGHRTAYGGTRTTLAMTAGTLQGPPFFVPKPTAINQIALSITTQAAAGKLIKLLLYDSLANGMPGALLDESGDLAADAIATVTYTVSRTLAPYHIYYLYAWSDGTPTVESTGGPGVFGMDSAADVGSGRCGAHRTLAYVSGAVTAPNPFGTISTYGSNVPNVTVRAV